MHSDPIPRSTDPRPSFVRALCSEGCSRYAAERKGILRNHVYTWFEAANQSTKAFSKSRYPKRNHSEGHATFVKQSRSISNALGRGVSALVLVWVAQFGVVLWFMIGQGYDRATAIMVPWAGLAMLPMWAWLLRIGLPDVAGGSIVRAVRALGHAAALYIAGLIVPAQVTLRGFSLSSPFDELWWVLGSATVILAVGLAWSKGFSRRSMAGPRGVPIGLLIVLGSGASVPLWRALIFSFFG